MKKNYCFLLLGLLSTGWLSAQEAAVASGGSATGVGGNSTYSVGQVVYTEISGSGISVTQGVQQPYEISVLGKDDHKDITLSIVAYPNPTVSFLTLLIDVQDPSGLRYQLFDLNGRLLRSEDIKARETSISMEAYGEATYVLNVYSGQTKIKTFKIIKKNI